ncbi:MAG: hypothetical protein BWX80_00771 [Candidatus Hydrogenedentes bacterium ADurb.Bin101]|nr:MAG: hypothetical protein BWX80_00771 [Candidatus Hydrogenedentes bacterium ADurb.Bin101]
MKPSFGVRKILAAFIIGGKGATECRLCGNRGALNPDAVRETQAARNTKNMPADHALVFRNDNRTIIRSQFNVSRFVDALQEMHPQTAGRYHHHGIVFTVGYIEVVQAVNRQASRILYSCRPDSYIQGCKRFVIGMHAFSVQHYFRPQFPGTGLVAGGEFPLPIAGIHRSKVLRHRPDHFKLLWVNRHIKGWAFRRIPWHKTYSQRRGCADIHGEGLIFSREHRLHRREPGDNILPGIEPRPALVVHFEIHRQMEIPFFRTMIRPRV